MSLIGCFSRNILLYVSARCCTLRSPAYLISSAGISSIPAALPLFNLLKAFRTSSSSACPWLLFLLLQLLSCWFFPFLLDCRTQNKIVLFLDVVLLIVPLPLPLLPLLVGVARIYLVVGSARRFFFLSSFVEILHFHSILFFSLLLTFRWESSFVLPSSLPHHHR